MVFDWVALDTSWCMYVAHYKVCHQIETLYHPHYIVNSLLPQPSNLLGRITTDLILYPIELIHTRTLSCLSIQSAGDIATQLTKYELSIIGIYFFEYEICKYGVPNRIVTDWATWFTSRFKTWVSYNTTINNQFYIPYHALIGFDTEWQKYIMEQHLCATSIGNQVDWLQLLSPTKFAYNDTFYSLTMMTPFWAIYHRNSYNAVYATKSITSLIRDSGCILCPPYQIRLMYCPLYDSITFRFFKNKIPISCLYHLPSHSSLSNSFPSP